MLFSGKWKAVIAENFCFTYSDETLNKSVALLRDYIRHGWTLCTQVDKLGEKMTSGLHCWTLRHTHCNNGSLEEAADVYTALAHEGWILPCDLCKEGHETTGQVRMFSDTGLKHAQAFRTDPLEKHRSGGGVNVVRREQSQQLKTQIADVSNSNTHRINQVYGGQWIQNNNFLSSQLPVWPDLTQELVVQRWTFAQWDSIYYEQAEKSRSWAFWDLVWTFHKFPEKYQYLKDFKQRSMSRKDIYKTVQTR